MVFHARDPPRCNSYPSILHTRKTRAEECPCNVVDKHRRAERAGEIIGGPNHDEMRSRREREFRVDSRCHARPRALTPPNRYGSLCPLSKHRRVYRLSLVYYRRAETVGSLAIRVLKIRVMQADMGGRYESPLSCPSVFAYRVRLSFLALQRTSVSPSGRLKKR